MDELNESPLIVFLKSNILILLLGLVGLGFGAFGLYQLFAPHQTTDILVQSESNSSEVRGVSDQKTTVFIDIEGAVKRPGVYELENDKRLKDVVAKAGGLTKDVNTSFVAKSVNMAAKIQDGMKIYIPFIGEQAPQIQESLNTGAGVAAQKSGLVSVNSASESELDTLPGVGPATAAKIVSSRPYASIDELLSKKAVGASVFSKIKDKISL